MSTVLHDMQASGENADIGLATQIMHTGAWFAAWVIEHFVWIRGLRGAGTMACHVRISNLLVRLQCPALLLQVGGVFCRLASIPNERSWHAIEGVVKLHPDA